MDMHRLFFGLLLVVCVIGVHAQGDNEGSSKEFADGVASRPKYRRLDGSASARKPANEDYSSAEDAISEFMKEMGAHKRPTPSPTHMSNEDYDWHIEEGEKVLKNVSQRGKKERELHNLIKRLWQAKERKERQRYLAPGGRNRTWSYNRD